MIVTEEEASELWCPEKRVASSYGNIPSFNQLCDSLGKNKHLLSYLKCDGTECMHWQWIDEKIKDKGYCGLSYKIKKENKIEDRIVEDDKLITKIKLINETIYSLDNSITSINKSTKNNKSFVEIYKEDKLYHEINIDRIEIIEYGEIIEIEENRSIQSISTRDHVFYSSNAENPINKVKGGVEVYKLGSYRFIPTRNIEHIFYDYNGEEFLNEK